MLTKITVKNFKKLDDVDIELGKSVVLIGPNNSGKTAALQALALWDIGLRQWNEKRSGKTSPAKRPGVTINRNELTSISVPTVRLLWRDLDVRYITKANEKQDTQNIRIDIIVEGITNGKSWSCGLEFDYANEESFYCRPLRVDEGKTPQRMPIPHDADKMRIAFLPPMSGLADREFIKQAGEIGVLIGQGQTAQVLRNLCYQIFSKSETRAEWKELCDHIKRLFGIEMLSPSYYPDRSEITMAYTEGENTKNKLDISASGRGLQQTLLLLAHLYANPHTVLLLDEPDAHLEVLRQQQIYTLLTEVAEKQGSQVIIASHSEVILNEAADKDIVIAFVGKPHRIDDRKRSQVSKALKEIGFDQYYLAEQAGWVLYLEGSTDLEILQTFAQTFGHPAANILERPFVHYVANQPQKARDHFYGLREGYPDLLGVAIFDRLDTTLKEDTVLIEKMWKRREIESYLCLKDVLMAYARSEQSDDLFGMAEVKKREQVMNEVLEEVSKALQTLGKDWLSSDIKITDEFLDPLFKKYFEKLQLPNLMLKNKYHVLARLVPKEKIDYEITEKLDIVLSVAQKSKPKKN